MRTAIFLGLLMLAKAVREDVHENTATGMAIIVTIMMIMDLIEFVKKINDE
jgi:hypothetical protein